MKLIFIYGPPAAGKLTVAKELAKLGDFKIFHNHVTVDVATQYFEFASKPFNEFIEGMRSYMLDFFLKNSMNVIFTFCYAHPHDDAFVEEIESIVARNGGQIFYVFLKASEQTLHERVLHESRKAFGKISSQEKLAECLERWNFTEIAGKNSLVIDNDSADAAAVARRIFAHVAQHQP